MTKVTIVGAGAVGCAARAGVSSVLPTPLDAAEQAALTACAEQLRGVASDLEL